MNVFPFLGYEPVDKIVSHHEDPDTRTAFTVVEWEAYGSCTNTCGSHPKGILRFFYFKPNWEDRPSYPDPVRREVGAVVQVIYQYYRGTSLIQRFVRNYIVNKVAYAQIPQSYQDLTCHPEIPRSNINDLIDDFLGPDGFIDPVVVDDCQTVTLVDGRFINDPTDPTRCDSTWRTRKYAQVVGQPCEDDPGPTVPPLPQDPPNWTPPIPGNTGGWPEPPCFDRAVELRVISTQSFTVDEWTSVQERIYYAKTWYGLHNLECYIRPGTCSTNYEYVFNPRAQLPDASSDMITHSVAANTTYNIYGGPWPDETRYGVTSVRCEGATASMNVIAVPCGTPLGSNPDLPPCYAPNDCGPQRWALTVKLKPVPVANPASPGFVEGSFEDQLTPKDGYVFSTIPVDAFCHPPSLVVTSRALEFGITLPPEIADTLAYVVIFQINNEGPPAYGWFLPQQTLSQWRYYYPEETRAQRI